MTRVLRARAGDASACTKIVAGLPDYFTDDVSERVRHDLARHQGWVLEDGDSVVGFVIVERRSPLAAEVLWAAVAPARLGCGLGTELVETVLDELSAEQVLIVEVKTLNPKAGYGPYLLTHRFWLARGFVQVDTIEPLPGWQPGNPCALLVAALAGTRRAG
jgi:GNAT superfamily N-acetyltransferase